MPQLWQCDDCGTRYRVNWLSHCYRCEGAPPKAKPKPEKQSKPRRGRMPRIVAGVGPSNADEITEQAAAEPVFEPLPEITDEVVTEVQVSEPVVPAVAPEPVADAVPVVPEPESAPVAVVDASVAAPKGGAQ